MQKIILVYYGIEDIEGVKKRPDKIFQPLKDKTKIVKMTEYFSMIVHLSKFFFHVYKKDQTFGSTAHGKLVNMEGLLAFSAQEKKPNTLPGTIKLVLSHKHSVTTVLRM